MRLAQILIAATFGMLIGDRWLHLRLRQGLFVRHQRSRRVRQLPHHGQPLPRLGEELASDGCRLQRLPHAAGAGARSTRSRRSTDSTTHSRSLPAGFPSRSESPALNADVTEKACRKCHAEIVSAIEGGAGRRTVCRVFAVTPPWGISNERGAIEWLRLSRLARVDSAPGHSSPPPWPRRVVTLGVVVPARQRLRTEAGSTESLLPRRRTDRRHRGPGDLGQELPAAVRRVSPDGRSAAHTIRRQ